MTFASLLALSLGLTACSGGQAPTAAEQPLISTNGSEPQKGLLPTNTSEVGGGKVLSQIFAGLVTFDATGKMELDQAASIEPSKENKVWTIKLRPGLTFSTGEAVTVQSFIDAWQYGALLSNAQSAAGFFDNFEGFSATKDSKLTGLKKVSDLEFVVTLKNPEVDFPLRLGYSAFMPMPADAYKDMRAFGESPVGNGPYKFETADAWKHQEGIRLVKNDAYQGPQEAKNAGLEIKFYAQPDSAYQDSLGGHLDVLDRVPSSAFGSFEGDFEGRVVNQPASIFHSLTIPQYLEHFKPGKEGELRRAAVSMAIDRASVVDKIFSNTATPAKDFSSPVINGFNADLKGNEVLAYNPTKAADLWKQADAISKYEGTFTIGYNADGDHRAWVDAVAGMIGQNLGITAEGKSYPTFKQLLDDEDTAAVGGGFRSGWQGDYPAQVNFLSQQYRSTGGSNKGRYDNPDFDAALDQAAAASSQEGARKGYSAAQEILMKDLPSIPLWNVNAVGTLSDRVDNVKFAWNSVPLYYSITLKN
ncbi:MAG: ABC transporter substrate-binding protein [Arthrobacter sp.]|jgi:oligopeptide transport system substrate-binding protein|nr:ABC transporter substrate-binding protein [Arthrobacter sp.]